MVIAMKSFTLPVSTLYKIQIHFSSSGNCKQKFERSSSFLAVLCTNQIHPHTLAMIPHVRGTVTGTAAHWGALCLDLPFCEKFQLIRYTFMRKKPHISIQRCKIETIPHHYCISVKRPNPKKTHTKRPFNVAFRSLKCMYRYSLRL